MAPQDPQIEFQDSNGNPKGYVYINNNDNVVLHHPSSGNEAILQDDGTFDVPAVNTVDLGIDGSDFLTSGDFVGMVSFSVDDSTRFSTTSTSYVRGHMQNVVQWDTWLPANAQSAVLTGLRVFSSSGDVRIRNNVDGETIHEQLDVSSPTDITLGPTNYSPTTTSSPIRIVSQVRTNDGSNSTDVLGTTATLGVQV